MEEIVEVLKGIKIYLYGIFLVLLCMSIFKDMGRKK